MKVEFPLDGTPNIFLEIDSYLLKERTVNQSTAHERCSLKPLPHAFFDADGEVDKDLLRTVLSRNGTFSQTIRTLYKKIGSKKAHRSITRLNEIAKRLQDREFRRNWYKEFDGNEKTKPLYEYVAFSKEDELRLRHGDLSIIDSISNVIKNFGCFLSMKGIERLLELHRKECLDDRSLALLLWAFMEVLDYKNPPRAESDEIAEWDDVKSALSHAGMDRVLHLCTPRMDSEASPSRGEEPCDTEDPPGHEEPHDHQGSVAGPLVADVEPVPVPVGEKPQPIHENDFPKRDEFELRIQEAAAAECRFHGAIAEHGEFLSNLRGRIPNSDDEHMVQTGAEAILSALVDFKTNVESLRDECTSRINGIAQRLDLALDNPVSKNAMKDGSWQGMIENCRRNVDALEAAMDQLEQIQQEHSCQADLKSLRTARAISLEDALQRLRSAKKDLTKRIQRMTQNRDRLDHLKAMVSASLHDPEWDPLDPKAIDPNQWAALLMESDLGTYDLVLRAQTLRKCMDCLDAGQTSVPNVVGDFLDNLCDSPAVWEECVIFAALSQNQIELLHHKYPNMRPWLVMALVRASLERGRLDLWYWSPLLSVTRDTPVLGRKEEDRALGLLWKIVEHQEGLRIGTLRYILSPDNGAGDAHSQKSYDVVMEKIPPEPHMGGHIAKEAHREIFAPLVPALKSKNVSEVRRLYNDMNLDELDLDDACERWNRTTKNKCKAYHHHIARTRRYVEDRLEALREWLNQAADAKPEVEQEKVLRKIIQDFKSRQIATAVPEPMHTIISWLSSVADGASTPYPLPWFPNEVSGRIAPSLCSRPPEPTWGRYQRSIHARGKVSWSDLVADLLAGWIGCASMTRSVRLLLDAGTIEQARSMLTRSHDLGENVCPLLIAKIFNIRKELKEDFKKNYPVLEKSVTHVQEPFHTDLMKALHHAGKSAAEGNWFEASELLNEVNDMLELIKQEQSDLAERQKLANEILAMGGKACPTENLDELRRLHKSIWDGTAGRRLHIKIIQEMESEDYPPVIRQAASATRQKLEPPAMWPTADDAGFLSIYLDIFVKRLTDAGIKAGHVLPEGYRQVLEDLANAVLSMVCSMTDGKRTPMDIVNDLESIFDGQKGIGSEEDARILLRTIHEKGYDVKIRHKPEQTEPEQPNEERVEIASVTAPPVVDEPHDLLKDKVAKIRSNLMKLAAQQPEVTPVPTQLNVHVSARGNHWKDTCSAVAAILKTSPPKEPRESLSDHEALFAIAYAYKQFNSGESLDISLVDICFAALSADATCRNDLRYFIPEKTLREFLVETALRYCRQDGEQVAGTDLRDSLLNFLLQLDMSKGMTHDLARLAEFLRPLHLIPYSNEFDGAGKMAIILSEFLTGAHNVSKPRTCLLLALVGLGEIRTVSSLGKADLPDHAGQLENVIVRLQSAEGNPNNLPIALALAKQLTSQLRKRSSTRNTKQWVELIQTMTTRVSESRQQETPVELRLVTHEVVREGSNKITLHIEIQIEPYLGPNNLEIRLAREGKEELSYDLSELDPIIDKDITMLTIDVSDFTETSSVLRIPYRVLGKTFKGEHFDLRSAWELTFAFETSGIDSTTLEHVYPGRLGRAISNSEHFFGRKDELDKIDRLLAQEAFGGLLLYGSRRIGKTSLLFQLLKSYPPAQGHHCAVFTDVSCLTIPDPQQMAKAFLELIVDQICTLSQNAELKQLLLQSSEIHSERQLEGTLKRSADINSVNVSLERLAHKIDTLTGGKVKRIVLMVDEFDRFVTEVMKRETSGVGPFMWGIRSVVQHSERIKLILAGSGLMKLLQERGSDGLAGSVPEIELENFKWPKDCVSIENIFLPREISGLICEPSKRGELSHHAYELTLGQPWHLCKIGFAIASFLKGRKLTTPLIDMVVDHVGQHDSPIFSDSEVKDFYMEPIFAPIEAYLPFRQQSIAKFILAEIARQTTIAHPHIKVTDAVACTSLGLHVTRNEKLEALKLLIKLRIVHRDHRGIYVQISLPVEHLALSRHADIIAEEARQNLIEFEDHDYEA